MANITTALDEQVQSLPSSKKSQRKPFKFIEDNFRHNLDSNYTEKIEELDKSFTYSSNSNHYWSEPELSLLYGTPLYEEASPSQKLGLNHLYWVSQYNFTALGETETIHYNRTTGRALAARDAAYEAIAQQLEHEATQERSHIHAFYKVNYQTMKSLLGKQAFTSPVKKTLPQQSSLTSKLPVYQYHALRLVGKMMLNDQEQYYSQYLNQFEADGQPAKLTTGFFHGRGFIPSSLVRFFGFNWGSSPFLACQYYTLRFMGNMLLKNIEHSIFLHYKKLQRQQEFTPVPTAISHYHFLDESFHTTTSQFLAQDLYKYFPEPSAYEKFVVNLTVYLIQRNNFNGISGVVNKRCFKDDHAAMVDIYKLLQSPLFDMSSQDALQWMKTCFCQEHEGFHESAKSYNHLLSDLRRLLAEIDYLWPVNREMRLMASEASIDKAIQNNINTFNRFAQSVA